MPRWCEVSWTTHACGLPPHHLGPIHICLLTTGEMCSEFNEETNLRRDYDEDGITDWFEAKRNS